MAAPPSGLGPPLNPLLGLSRILSSQQKCCLRGGVAGRQFLRNLKLILKGCVHTLLQSMRGSSTRSLTWKRIIKQPKNVFALAILDYCFFSFWGAQKLKWHRAAESQARVLASVYTAISRKVVGKSAISRQSRKALWVFLSSLFFKEIWKNWYERPWKCICEC